MKRLMILTVGRCLLFAAVPAMAQSAADEAAVRKANEEMRRPQARRAGPTYV